ncbi:hypothetical protein CYL21_4660 [Plasmodium falciparum NF54]|uniref:Uncharacterized protein n=3 Tax=Plasmodium falciparum TaxID=5833 RepID=Q8I565_PLAF7|nr:conserved Plasmodium protein, unknown function [Plasmodium falciparum 3D7]KAF4327179.1 hypothetical protein CYL21_4660 [Plasmodium falciparum NF54]PKC48435.1 hypothetical protein CK202_1859 [Plasmodium falciparum NF54]CZT99517.1 conserved Plasmodium protein, unknown function [Plasmodium falciparum 3D7]|eukprot:XP_001350752.2 conserved Plasmodium protein, unknown function [Plasmodium falciparum 3D7]
MEYTFLFYKHKHLIHLKENFEHIESYITYSLDSSFHNVNLVNDKEKDTILNHRECEYNNLTYEQIIDILQYSSICVSVCEKCQNGEKVNIVGIVSLDYELCINNNTNKYNFERMCDCPNINLEDFYYSLSLHIKAYNILSNLTLNNTLIINLILNNNENYYDNLFYYLFHSIENLLFILLFYNNNNIINEDLFSNGLTIDLTNLTQYEKQNKIIPFDHVLILNKSTYVSKIFLRLTSTSDIYDLHELFKKFSQTNLEEKNHYLIYDIIDKKTDEDILITILNNKKKIIGFVSLKKYIDINILVNLYNLKEYNYLLKRDFFEDISDSLKPYKNGSKSLNKRKKKYLYIEFKQHILRTIKIKTLEDLEKKYEISNETIYDYLYDHLIEDVDIYADYFKKKNIDIKDIVKNIYKKLQYDYANYKKGSTDQVDFFLLNKLINLYSHISFSDIANVSQKFYNNFEKIEKLYFNFNNDKTYKKIYEKIKKKRDGIISDDESENNSSKINIIKLTNENEMKKNENNFKEVINLSYFDIFLLLQNIYPETFKKNEIILLFLFLDLYELIIVEETTLFDCVSFKMFLDELVHIKKNYFICKYKHIDWLRNISNDDKNAFSLNLFILNDKYYSYCKDILLKIEKYFDEVDYIITTNNERGNMPFILNYFNRVKKKKKANTLESLYILNKYTLFLQPTTDYMKLEDIEHVQRLLEKVKHKEKNKIKQYILFLQDYCKDEVRKDNQHDHLLVQSPLELKFYELHNYYIYVSRCGNNIINITTGSIMNNMDFYYINKIYDFKNILIPNENEKMKHFRLFFFSSIIIFKYYDKKIIHNILMLTNACSCQISTDDDVYLDIYRHFIFLNKKDNDVSIFREDNIFLRESEKTKKNEKNRNDRKNTKQCDKKYLVLTKHMCLRKCINIDHNIVFWGTNDICLNILYKILRKNEYFFNNIILIIAYKNKYLNTKNNVEENKSVKNCSLESALMYNKLKNIMINERIKIIYDNVYNINRKNKQIELNNKNYIYYDYLFICFDKQDVTTYSFNLNSFEEGKKRNFNFIETYENMNYKNIKFDFLVKEKDYEKYEHVNTFYSQKKKNYLLKKKKKTSKQENNISSSTSDLNETNSMESYKSCDKSKVGLRNVNCKNSAGKNVPFVKKEENSLNKSGKCKKKQLRDETHTLYNIKNKRVEKYYGDKEEDSDDEDSDDEDNDDEDSDNEDNDDDDDDNYNNYNNYNNDDNNYYEEDNCEMDVSSRYTTLSSSFLPSSEASVNDSAYNDYKDDIYNNKKEKIEELKSDEKAFNTTETNCSQNKIIITRGEKDNPNIEQNKNEYIDKYSNVRSNNNLNECYNKNLHIKEDLKEKINANVNKKSSYLENSNKENVSKRNVFKSEEYININNENDKNVINQYNEKNEMFNKEMVNRNIDGVFSISDPFLEKYFDKNSKYMNIVKNCVNYIIIYSNNIDILNMINFLLINNVHTYKIIIIYPYTCNKCHGRKQKEKIKQNIFNERIYYKDKSHLKNNYLFCDYTHKNNFYHKNYVFENIKYVLNKIFFLFHLLKIRIIYGHILAVKKSKKNRLKYVLVHLCKHRNLDLSYFNTHKFICENTLLIPCRILLCSYIFDINNHLHYILNKSSIVYNEKICVNHQFQTNDKFIFSAGELCAFSNKYRISTHNILNHEYYSSMEIGKFVSRQFLKIVIEQCCLSYNMFKSKNEEMRNKIKKQKDYNDNIDKIIEKDMEETNNITGNVQSKKTHNNLDLYKKLKIFEIPIIYFNTLPCNFYFYHFEASRGDLYKYNDFSIMQNEKIKGMHEKKKYSNKTNDKIYNNEKNDMIDNSEQIYHEAFCTDSLKISINKEKKMNNYFNVQYFEISKNIYTQGYYCKVTTNSFNLINSFTYLGCDVLNFHKLHKLCNMPINYFYVILKNIKNNPQYDILSMLNEDREKSIFHYKFHIFKEKLKKKIITLPHIKESIQFLLKDINDGDSFKTYIKDQLFKEKQMFIDTIKKEVESNLVEYIKENNELLNGYYIPN